jgi:C1A family cysteine protease
MFGRNEKLYMGWLPDYPDFRDFTVEHDTLHQRARMFGQKDSIKTMIKKAGVIETGEGKLPSTVDLREWCSVVENQKTIGSCTAHAGVGLIEYFERRAFGKHVDTSRLFLYKVTRNMMRMVGDTGAYLRTTMGAMVLFGVPPEEYWPYVVEDFDVEPSAFCYAFGQNYQTISYYRLDQINISRDDLLLRIKTNLSAALPSMFGFSVYSSISQAATTGKIPFPNIGERLLGGHAVVTIGYDDGIKITNSNPGGHETTGALLIRNSWGTEWGENGYGWLPYEYVLKGLAVDWWSVLKNEWIDTGQFTV